MRHHIDLFAPLRSRFNLTGLVGAYSLRHGGVSESPFDSMNLGFSTGDDPDSVRINRVRFAQELKIPVERWVVAGQCHGHRVLEVTGSDVGEGALTPSERLRGYDAIVLAEANQFALSLCADCPLVIVADPRSIRAGIAHAGWRGTAAGVVEEMLEVLQAAGSELSHCFAAISPGICGDCFEVGEEVFEAVAQRPGAELARSEQTLDLRAIHREILRSAGLSLGQICESKLCSYEDTSNCFSHRRDRGQTGRNGVILGFRGPCDR